MSAVPVLVCRECGTPAPGSAVQYCGECFGPLELRRDPEHHPVVDRVAIDAGHGMDRWAPLLGISIAGGGRLGDAPVVAAPTLGAALGIPRLHLLDETRSPSRSFKDRVVATALGEALRRGSTTIACASTGNLARAVGLGAAAAGVRAVLLVPEDLDPGRMAELVATGASVVAVRGGYDAVNRLSSEAAMAHDDWGWVNVGLRPWYVEGARTSGFDIARGLGWKLPDRVIGPIASGAYLRMVHAALASLPATGLVAARQVRCTGAQPAGCAPVARAWADDAPTVRPVRPETIATCVAMGDPPEGDDLLERARRSGGTHVSVPEDEILGACAQIAALEGLTVDPAVGVVVRGLGLLVERGEIEPDELVVACCTGAAAPAMADAPADPAATIEPTLEALDVVLGQSPGRQPPPPTRGAR